MDTTHYRKGLLLLGFILIGLLTCAIYWPGLYGPFVFDDLTNILLVPALHVTGLDFDSLRRAAFWQENSGIGRPVAMLTFALNYYLGGMNVYYFKLTNLIIHVCNGVLLFWLGVKLLQRLHSRPEQLPFTRQHIQWISLAIAAAWLVHPLNLTSVLYVVQRETSLAAFFILLGLAGYLLGREQILKGKRYGLLTIIASLVVCGGVGILSKENGVLLPLYMLVIEVIFFRFESEPRLKRQLIILWLLIFTLPLASLTVVGLVKPSVLSTIFTYNYRDFTLGDRLLTETRALWYYLRLIIFPNIKELGIYHDDFVISRGLLDPPITFQAVIGIFGLLAVAVLTARKLPILSFGIAWFFAGHILESTIIPLELVHEHRNYLPQFGILFSAIYYLAYPYHQLSKSLVARRILVLLFIGMFAGVTYARALDWKDEWTLYLSDVVNHPNSARANTTFGIILQDNKQYALAATHFNRAVELAPRDPTMRIRLAQHYYGATGNIPDKVMQDLEYAMLNLPYSGVALWTYEPLLRATFNDPKLHLRVLHIYEKAIVRSNFHLGDQWRDIGYRTLGFTYRARKNYPQAAYYFNKALELNTLPRYYLILADIYATQGNTDSARSMLKRLETHYASLTAEDKLAYDDLHTNLFRVPKRSK